MGCETPVLVTGRVERLGFKFKQEVYQFTPKEKHDILEKKMVRKGTMNFEQRVD
jgi:hypothetical protein